MIPKRFYLTALSLLPILSAHALVAVWALRRARSGRISLQLWSAAVTLGTLLILVTLLADFEPGLQIPRGLMTIAQTFVNLCGPLGAVTLGLFLLFRSASKRLPPSFRQDRRTALRAIAGIGLVAPMGVAGFGVFVERTNFEICETAIPVRNLPDDLNGLRLVQISDIHLSPYLSARTLARVVDSANELKPDFAFITGDLITSKGDPLDECLIQLSRLKARGPKLGCLGNHEVYADAVDHTVREGARAGIEFLRGRARRLKIGNSALNIAGVDYEPFGPRSSYLRHAASMIEPGAFNVLLSHNPDVFPVAAAQGYDLTLAGHMHGGQVTVEILSPALNPARILTPFVRGLYREGDRACYVTRGIGTLGVPARLGSRPEITLLTLRQA
jgi:hypothetical protein